MRDGEKVARQMPARGPLTWMSPYRASVLASDVAWSVAVLAVWFGILWVTAP